MSQTRPEVTNGLAPTAAAVILGVSPKPPSAEPRPATTTLTLALTIAALIGSVLLPCLGAGQAAHAAAVFTVDDPSDGVDDDLTDGLCATTAGVCTLRAAIEQANALAGADTIDFDTSSFSVPPTIVLGSPLPAIAQDLTIKGPVTAVLTVDAAGTGSVFRINSGVTVEMSDLTITGGSAGAAGGGGIHNRGTLTLTNVTVRGNTAEGGGGIYSIGPLMILASSTVSGNTATGGTTNLGGGILHTTGTVILNSSTVSGNTATGGINPAGGGIANYQGTLTLNNSTVSGNVARYGGGIANANNAGALTLNNSTVAYNTALVGFSHGLRVNGGTVTLKNTILANDHNCDFSFANSPLNSLDHNLSTDLSCQSTASGGPIVNGGLDEPNDLNSTPAHLAPLALNPPGRTQTHALCTGLQAPDAACAATSPAIDAVPGNCTDAAGSLLAADQRGVSRPQPPGACDMGAYEVGADLTGLGPAKVWIGLKNSDAVGLRADLRAEVFVDDVLIGSGELANVPTGGSGFNKALLQMIPLALSGDGAQAPAGAELAMKVSVRRTCFGGGHNNGVVRLWYNGKKIDTGSARDAGSRFDATIGGDTSDVFLRSGFALSEAAGTSRMSVDTTVNSTEPCPGRPFISLGAWSTTLP